jgi:hypothetical protein
MNKQTKPQHQVTVTHATVDYVIESFNVIVRGKENGFDTGTVLLTDTQAMNYMGKVSADDVIKIEQKDESDSSWKTVLGNGTIRRVEPILNISGNILKIECDGAGYGYHDTVCAEEYGSDSDLSGWNDIKSIVEGAAYGVNDQWVEKVRGPGSAASGHTYLTAIEDIAGSIPYIYFPYKPNDKVLGDLCLLHQALLGTNAGPHWIITPAKRLCIATVGAHPAAPVDVAQYWPTWWRTDLRGSTLVEGVDFTEFKFQDLSKEANYVLYHGRFQRPVDGDAWTKSSAASWGDGGGGEIRADDATAGEFLVGANSVRLEDAVPAEAARFFYPSTQDLALDLTAFGGRFNPAELNLYLQLAYAIGAPSAFEVRLWTSAGNYFWTSILAELLGMGTAQFKHFRFPVGTNTFETHQYSGFNQWQVTGAPVWTNINAVEIAYTVAAGAPPQITYCWIDGLLFTGHVLRAARQVAAYSATDKLRMKVITDEVAKDDTGKAGTPGTTDIGTMGLLCKAEYLRLSSTPVVGAFTIPIANDLLPGQQVHVHAKKQASGAFRIDDTFRVTRFVHNMNQSGYTTRVEVTDDLVNAYPRPMPTQLNTLLGAVRPEFQDRQATSLKTRQIDVTQTVLEESY